MIFSFLTVKNWKQFFTAFLLIFLFSLLSCQTTGKVLNFALPDDVQQYYIRSTHMKKSNFDVDIDFTIRVKDDVVFDDVTVNYTIRKLPFSVENFNDISVRFLSGNKVLPVGNQRIIIKNMDPFEVRYTSTLSPADFTWVLHNADDLMFEFDYRNGKTQYMSKEINKVLSDFKVIVK